MGSFVARSLVVVALASLGMVTGCAADADDGSAAGDEDDVTASAAKFETFEGVDGQTHFHLVAGNGQLVLQSEAYTSVAGAQKGVASIKDNGGHADAYRVAQAKNGEYYFNLVAPNNEVIGTSELYASKANAERGAEGVRKLVIKIKRWETVAAKPEATFGVFKGIDGQHRFNLRAKNGEIVLQSEGYTTRESALKGIASVRDNGKRAAAFTVFEAASGDYALHLQAGNGEIIAHGETYSTKANAERAVARMTEMLGARTPVPGPDAAN